MLTASTKTFGVMYALGYSREVDLIVIGAGAAGMTAALTGSLLGLDVVLLEKVVGGTSACAR